MRRLISRSYNISVGTDWQSLSGVIANLIRGRKVERQNYKKTGRSSIQSNHLWTHKYYRMVTPSNIFCSIIPLNYFSVKNGFKLKSGVIED